MIINFFQNCITISKSILLSWKISSLKLIIKNLKHVFLRFLWWAFLFFTGLPPAVLGPNILSKRVESSSTGTQIGPACAQTMLRLSGACLWQVELF